MKTTGTFRHKGQPGCCRTCRAPLGSAHASWCSGGVMLAAGDGPKPSHFGGAYPDTACAFCHYLQHTPTCPRQPRNERAPSPASGPEAPAPVREGWHTDRGGVYEAERDDRRAAVWSVEAMFSKGGAAFYLSGVPSPGIGYQCGTLETVRRGWSWTAGNQPEHSTAESAMAWADAKLASEAEAAKPKAPDPYAWTERIDPPEPPRFDPPQLTAAEFAEYWFVHGCKP